MTTLAPAAEDAAAIPPFADAPPAAPPRFSVEGKALAASLALITEVSPRRITLPVLEGVRLASSERGVTAHVTDLDLWATVPVSGAERQSTGAVVLPYKGLRQFLKVQGGALEFVGRQATGEGVSLKFADVDNGEGLPVEPELGADAAGFALPYADLKAVASRVAFAVSTDATRPILQHVSMQRVGKRVEWCATNGHRLALIEAEAPEGLPDAFAVLLTPKTLRVAVRMFKGQETVWCRFTEGYAEFSGAGRVLVARLGRGPYPNYRQVIPDESTRTAEVSRVALAGAVRTALVVVPPQTHRLALVLSGGDTLSVEAQELLIGEVKVSVPATVTDAERFAIGLDAHYLLAALSRSTGDTARIGLTEPERAAVTTSDADEGFTQLLMPLRLL